MKKTLEVINELKEEKLIKDYAIGGAIGVMKWVEPFLTYDLDVFILLVEKFQEKNLIMLTPIYEYLKKKGYQWEKHWIIIEGVPVDIFPADELEKEAIENAVETEYEGTKTKIICPEYLIALSLRTKRDKDIRKIQMLLEQTKIDNKKLNQILKKYKLTEEFVKFKKKVYGK